MSVHFWSKESQFGRKEPISDGASDEMSQSIG